MKSKTAIFAILGLALMLSAAAALAAAGADESDAAAPEYVTLTIEPNGGTPNADTVYTLQKGTQLQLPAALYTRPGYHLDYYFEPIGGAILPTFGIGPTFAVGYSKTLICHWAKDCESPTGLVAFWNHSNVTLDVGQTWTDRLNNSGGCFQHPDGSDFGQFLNLVREASLGPNYYSQSSVGIRSGPPGMHVAVTGSHGDPERNMTMAFTAGSPGVYYCELGFRNAAGDDKIVLYWTLTVRGNMDPPRTVAFDANGGTCGVPQVQVPQGGSIVLPQASQSGYTLDGWYTAASGGTRAGVAGGSYSPPGDAQLFAHWTKDLTYTAFTNGSTYTIQTSSGAVIDYRPATDPSDATVWCTSFGDLGGKLAFSGGRLHGQLSDVLPVGGSGYPVHLRAHSDARDVDGYQTVYVKVTTTFMPPIEASVAAGSDFVFSPSIIPTSARITSVSVVDNATGAAVPQSQYSVSGVPGKTLTFRFGAPGVYKITATATSSAGSAAKILLLDVFEPEDTASPTCGRIVSSQDAAVGGAYAFTVMQPAHWTSITWDFGDGGSASGQSATHAYTTTGSRTVTCTVHNSKAAGAQTVVRTATVTVDSLVRLGTDAWAGCPYDYSFSLGPGPHEGTPETAAAKYLWEAHYSDDGSDPLWLDVLPQSDAGAQPIPEGATPTQTWLSARSFVRSDGTAALRLFSDDGPQASLAGRTLVVNVRLLVTAEDGAVLQDDAVRNVEIAIWPKVDVGGGSGAPPFSTEYGFEPEGMTVRMRPASMTADQAKGVRLFVDWGEGAHGTPVIHDASLATHTYLSPGQYTIRYYVKYNAIEPAMQTHTVLLPAGSAVFTLIFDKNAEAATGSMESLSGANSYTVPACAFSLAGESFLHWSTAADGGGSIYRPGDAIQSAEGAVRLYAIWSGSAGPGRHAVFFDAAGGSAVAPQTVDHGTPAAEPADPVREGYDFAGWYLGGAAYDFSAPVTSDITLTAHWAPAGPAPGGGGGSWLAAHWWLILIVLLAILLAILLVIL